MDKSRRVLFLAAILLFFNAIHGIAQMTAGNAVTCADCGKAASGGNSKAARNPPPPPRPNPYEEVEKASQQQMQQTNRVLNNAADAIIDSVRSNRSSAANRSGDPVENDDVSTRVSNNSSGQQQQPSPGSPPVFREGNNAVSSVDSGSPAVPNVASAIGALLDADGTSRTASTINSILGDVSAPGLDSRGTANRIADLISGDKDMSSAKSSRMNQSQLATPSIASLNVQEQRIAQAIGSDWASSFRNLKDEALYAIKALSLSPADAMAGDSNLDKGDYLKSGAEEVIKDFLPQSGDAESTLGASVQEKAVSYASDKVADTLTEGKDELACSSADSEVEHSGCMVLVAPTNIGRGLRNYGNLLVDRYGKMMDSVNAEFSTQTH